MMRFRERLHGFNQLLACLEESLVTFFIALLLVLNAYAVLARYLFAYYPPWIIEVSEALLVYIVFLGGAWLYRKRRQIAMTVLVDRVIPEGGWRQLVIAIGEVAVLIFALVTLWQAVVYQPILFRRQTEVLGLPKNVSSILVPVAYISIALSCAENLLERLKKHP
jgi:TRAP-type C4-dicarboxylate transport system permease small subunit